MAHSATQISNFDWQDEDQGICNRKMMCLYMQKGFSGRKKHFSLSFEEKRHEISSLWLCYRPSG